MIEMKHNTLKLRNPENLRFEAVPGLVLGVNSQDIVPAIEEVVEPVIQEVAIAAVAENSYVKDGDEIKQLIFEMTHPIGSIIYTSNSANPSTYLGGGKWTQIKDVFLLAAGDTYEAGNTGGEAEHTLIEKELPIVDGTFAVDVVPQHATNGVTGHAYGTIQYTISSSKKGAAGSIINSGTQYGYGFKFGNNEPHNNMPPYKAVYIWERTA